MKLTVLRAAKETLQSGDTFLEVEFELDNGEIQEVRSLGFPVDITEKALMKELEKYKETFFKDLAGSKEEKVKAVSDKKVEQLIEKVVGKEI